jgi:hypothetical protein
MLPLHSMQKAIAILLLSVTFLGSLVDLHDFAKLPRLLEHYQEHLNKSPEVSFLGFLDLHYGSQAEHHDQEEHQKHTGLPFKSPDCTFTHTVTVLPIFKAPDITSLVSEVSYSNFYHSTFSSAFSQSIWQPPKKS